MKSIIAIIVLIGLGLTAQAQYWTTNVQPYQVTNTVPTLTTNETGEAWVQTQIISTQTSLIITPILTTNTVRCVITAEAEAQLRELHATLKDDGTVTGPYNAWFDTTANAAVGAAMTSKAGELSATKEARIIRLWQRASVAQQTNALQVLK